MAGAHNAILSIGDNIRFSNTYYGVSSSDFDSAYSYAAVTIGNNGVVSGEGVATSGDPAEFNSYDWAVAGAAQNYDLYATLAFGNTPEAGSTPLNTWVNLGTSRSWSYSAQASGSGQSQGRGGQLNVQVALASNRSIIVSTFTVQVEAFASAS